MSENMSLWGKINKPPTSALKKISGGRMNGKTDISPMWRIQAMTEQFGPCGTGWRYSIDKLWTEPGEGGNVAAFALVSVAYQSEGVWSEPIPGIGGSMLVTKESSGHHTSDEAYKMAVTDALSVAFKALGMAADVYLGKFDGSKYKDEDKAVPEPPKPINVPAFAADLHTFRSVKELEDEYKSAEFQKRLALNSKEEKKELTRVMNLRIAELAPAPPAMPAAAQAVLNAMPGSEVVGTRPAFANGKSSGMDPMPFPFD